MTPEELDHLTETFKRLYGEVVAGQPKPTPIRPASALDELSAKLRQENRWGYGIDSHRAAIDKGFLALHRRFDQLSDLTAAIGEAVRKLEDRMDGAAAKLPVPQSGTGAPLL